MHHHHSRKDHAVGMERKADDDDETKNRDFVLSAIRIDDAAALNAEVKGRPTATEELEQGQKEGEVPSSLLSHGTNILNVE